MLQPRHPRTLTRAAVLPLLRKPGRDGLSALDRFHMRFQPGRDRDCWLWRASVNSDGYGQLHVAGLNVLHAHQIAYLLVYGDIGPGQVVMHTCDEPRCLNPAHLTLGTKRTNMQDASEKGRLFGPKPRRMTPELVRSIRKRHADGEQKAAIARDLGMNRHTVVKAINGRTWRHVTDGEEAAA